MLISLPYLCPVLIQCTSDGKQNLVICLRQYYEDDTRPSRLLPRWAPKGKRPTPTGLKPTPHFPASTLVLEYGD
jgi:hypothetical protein